MRGARITKLPDGTWNIGLWAVIVVFYWRYGFDFHWVRGRGKTARLAWGKARMETAG